MAGNIPYTTRTFKVGAGQQAEVNGSYSFISLLTATDVTNVAISFNGSSFDLFVPGITLKNVVLPLIDKFFIKNTGGVDNTITLGVGQADIQDNRLRIDASSALPVSGTVTANVANFPAQQHVLVDISLSLNSLVSAGTTNETLVKNAAGSVKSILAQNTTGAAKFVRFYNMNTVPTPGTDVPIFVLAIPANSSKEIFAELAFSAGIAFSITGAAAANDATAVAAGDVVLSVFYK